VRETFEVKLERIRHLSQSTLDFRFVKTDGCPVEFEPGQFFRFRFVDGGGEFERSYSLCNFADDVSGSCFLDLVVSTVEGGRASNYLFTCKEGITANVSGPFGRLLVPSPLPKRLILVATSVGIAPFMPILTKLMTSLENELTKVVLLFGARDREEFLYREELLEIVDRHKNFSLQMCYSRDNLLNQESFEHKGYVTKQLQALRPNAGSDHVLLCGHPQMIDDCYSFLKEAGFGVRQVTREKYVFAREAKTTKKSELSDEQKRLIAEKMKKYQK
jgi:ferredoxin-NADP reductase